MANDIGLAKEQTFFAVKETTKGTLVYPTVANDIIVCAGYVEMNQNPSFTNSDEIKNSRDVINRFQDKTPAGAWSAPIYARPSGTAGNVPMGDVLYEALMGLKTINGGVSVVYSQALTKPSFSLWAMQGHTVFFARGATVSECGISATNKGGVLLNFSGGFMELGWAGTDTLNGAALIDATVLTVVDAKKFTVGARIYNATLNDHNTNAGYEVTAVDTATNQITVTDGAAGGISQAWADTNVIAGYINESGTPIGTPLENRKLVVSVDAVATALQTFNMNLGDPCQYMEDEISSSDYPEDYLEGERNIAGNMSLYFRQDDLKYFYDGLQGNIIDIAAVYGDTAGSIMTIDMDRVQAEVPRKAVNAPAVNLDIPIMALGNNGEDSATITFT